MNCFLYNNGLHHERVNTQVSCLKRELRPIFHPAFWHIFVNCMVKEPSAKFSGILLIFHEVIKLLSLKKKKSSTLFFKLVRVIQAPFQKNLEKDF